MKNPFPGMNPYLEPYWTEVHTRMIVYAGDQLQRQLPRGLAVHLEQNIFLDEEGGPAWPPVRPDVHVTEGWQHSGGAGGAALAVATEPELVDLDANFPFRHLEIRDHTSGSRVITAIEIISPTNKTSGYGDYKEKQVNYISGQVSLVEVDLIRTGRPVVWVTHKGPNGLRLPPCLACVHRSWNAGRCEVYRMPLAVRLPSIRIPLRPTDPDSVLDLQSLLDQCHENGSYDSLSYAQDPACPLSVEEREWMDGWLKQRGLRSGSVKISPP